MAEVRTEFTGDASSLSAATEKAQEGINGVLDASNKAAGTLGQLNQVVELAAKAQKGLAAASAFLSTGTAAVTVAVKAQTIAFLSSPLAPVAAAVMALGAAYAYLSSELDAANEKVETANALAEETQKSAEKLASVKRSIADAEAIATGKTTEDALKLRDTTQKITEAYAPFIEAKKKAIAAAQEEGSSTTQLEAALKGLEAQQAKQVASATTVYDIAVAAKKAHDEEAAATKRAAAAAAARDKAMAKAAKILSDNLATQKAMVEETKKAADALLEQVDASAALVEQVNQLNETEEERIARNFRDLDQMLSKQIEVDKAMGISTAALEKARVDLREKTKQQYAKLAESELKDQQAADQAKVDSAEEAAQKIKDSNNDVADAFSDIAGSISSIAAEIGARIEEALAVTQSKIEDIDSALSDLAESGVNSAELQGEALVEAYLDGEVAAEDLSSSQKKFIKSELEARKKALKEKEAAEKKAALVAFRVQQGVAIAQAVIGTAQGIIQAFQLGPIAGAIAAVAIGVIGATQIALIASQKPSFAAGGFLDAAPTTGVGVTMHPNEAVLNQQGRKAIGDQAIIDANNGTLGGQGSGRQSTTIVYKHKPFEYFMRDNIAMNGTIAKTIRKGDRVGQVRRGRG